MIKISAIGVLGLILPADLFELLTYLLEVLIIHLLVLFLQGKGTIVFINVFDLMNTVLFDLSFQHFLQFLNSLVPDGVGELQHKAHYGLYFLVSDVFLVVNRFLGLSDLFLIHDRIFDPLAKLVEFLLHEGDCAGDVLLHPEPCHFLRQVVLNHRLDEIVKHAFERLLEDALDLLFKVIRIEANKGLKALEPRKRLFSLRVATGPPLLRHFLIHYDNQIDARKQVTGSSFPLVQYLMSKRLQLQEYLDEQLERLNGEEGKELLPFSRIEEKLSTIEKKLVLLKDQNLLGSRASKAQSEGRQRGERKEVECQYEGGKSKVMEEVSKRQMEVQMTPQKQLKLISKTMSEGLFQFKSGSKQKSKSKQYQSAAKTNKEKEVKRSKSPQTLLHLTTVKKGKAKAGNSCKKLSYNSASKINKTHDQHLAELKKDIDICIKSNQQLKLKINHLQVYKNQYCKLKEIFEKCERVRKRKARD